MTRRFVNIEPIKNEIGTPMQYRTYLHSTLNQPLLEIKDSDRMKFVCILTPTQLREMIENLQEVENELIATRDAALASITDEEIAQLVQKRLDFDSVGK